MHNPHKSNLMNFQDALSVRCLTLLSRQNFLQITTELYPEYHNNATHAILNYTLGICEFFLGKCQDSLEHLLYARQSGVITENLFDFLVPLCDWLSHDELALEIIAQANELGIKSAYFCHFSGEFYLRQGQWDIGFDYLKQGQIDYIPKLQGKIPEFWGQDLTNQDIVLAANLGFGDSFMASRYLENIYDMPYFNKARAISIRAPQALLRLMQINFKHLKIKEFSDAFGAIHTKNGLEIEHNFIQGLWLIHNFMGSKMNHAVGKAPNWQADEAEIKNWYHELKKLAGGKNILALVCAGRHDGQFGFIHARRVPPIEAWRELKNLHHKYYIIGLQPPPFPPLVKQIYQELFVHDLGNRLGDFATACAILKNCDALISVDSALIHLGASMDLPCYMPNRADSCWRWYPLNQPSYWYPNLNISQQKTRHDWHEAMRNINQSLMN